jgi:UDP-N-acetylmuramoyl-tripeptide--D-alanyl-D-alanine ligase
VRRIGFGIVFLRASDEIAVVDVSTCTRQENADDMLPIDRFEHPGDLSRIIGAVACAANGVQMTGIIGNDADQPSVHVLNFDNANIAKHKCSATSLKYGIEHGKLDYKASKLQTTESGQSFEFSDKDSHFSCETKLLGQHNIENLTGAIAVARYLGVPEKDIQFTVKRIKAAPHRLELNSHGKLNIIDDSYNSNPVSASLAVDTLCKFDGKHVVVTPGLIELGDDEERYNQELGEHIAKQNPDYVYLVGKSSQTDAIEAGLQAKKYPARNIQRVSLPQEGVNFAKARYPSEKLNILLLNDLPDNY